MKKVSQISHRVILLLVDIILLLLDILVFAYQTIRVLVLPTRRRKGNILSSLLSFFVGLVEKVISFEKSILRRPVIFKHRYVKQGLVLAAGFLFLLSSIEWTVGPAAERAAGPPAEWTPRPAAELTAGPALASPVNETKIVVAGESAVFTPEFSFYKSPSPVSGGPVTVKRFIRYCVFRI